MITQSELKEVLNYDPDTGIFTWKIKSAYKITIGDVAGNLNSEKYIVIKIKYKLYKAHRLAWLYVYGEYPQYNIDHINCVRNDNRISNLRDIPQAINMQNQNKAQLNNKSSGLLGVCKRAKRDTWQAYIRTNKIRKHLGTFKTKELAHEAYLKAKRELHLGCTI
jgi:hypothetical protein